ncbi:hypothetical protein UFOVP1169_48 [uncultured Caudovirales phage]|uniref:Uncharacterized protein n=1 Tax=uncultured Caudovirales phage TaxID=2100421 RepID=A0A6J5R036_9CAUD|nr:hypothetical protein UFOVP1169_48 [uncultured Caudovirales phage]
MNALDRLKDAAKSDAWHETVAVKDLALVLAVVDALEDAAGTIEHLALHHRDCLGWVGHDKEGGPWPEIQERAHAARKALEALTEDKP